MDRGKKRRKKAKPKDKRSRNNSGDRFSNSGKFYPSHKVDSIEMLCDEEKGNSDLDCDTQLSFPPPAILMNQSFQKMHCVRKFLSIFLEIAVFCLSKMCLWRLPVSLSQNLQMQHIAVPIIFAQDTTSANFSCNPFNNIMDWRSFNFEVMDEGSI